MTNEQLLEDMKQFITATVSQRTAGLATKEDLDGLATKEDVSRLETRMDERFNDVDGQLDEIQNAIGTDLKKIDAILEDHGGHLKRLDRKFA
ncbi:hypothetical protein G3I60_20135 [Streptomyces sp. SID13666]|uniref:hypothetical protein n=1 Tax=Streptomyces sp. SID13666 TaxID=2706054 RepID=UPI0013C097FD|nr:hypothetical protein [Streptomyces sp. SID13666]NEA56391.1 hypothetical protein [Streptomyces sp. SID13666]